jgi:uncharacterized protein DUF4157
VGTHRGSDVDVERPERSSGRRHDPALAETFAPAPTWFAEPAATVASFGRMTGVDLGFVPMVRDPAADREADRGDASAFTRHGVIHLPTVVSAVDSPDTEALVAHELTHVLQQRTLGPQPDEDGPLGDALEPQADGVERSVRGEPVDDAERAWPESVAEAMPAGLAWTPQTGFQSLSGAPGGGGQRAPRDAATASGASDYAPRVAGDDAIVPLAYPDADRVSADPAPAQTSVSRSPDERVLSDDEVSRVADRVRSGLVFPELDPKDPDLLDVLAAGLYGRLRTSLRSELIADRERAGVLTEFH